MQEAIPITESFHLPRGAWKFVTALQEETHPDVPLDDFSVDIVTREVAQSGTRADPRCPRGKRREVSWTLQLYFTVTIKGKLTKDPEKECSYKTQFTFSASNLKARIKPDSYKEGECK